MCWSCSSRKAGSEREPAGDAPLWHQRQSRSHKTCECEGWRVQHIIHRPDLCHMCIFYSDPWLPLWVQVHYCPSNSLLKCLHLQYVQTLLRLRCLDNWPDHQSKAPAPQSWETWQWHLFIQTAALVLPQPHQVGLEPQRKKEHEHRSLLPAHLLKHADICAIFKHHNKILSEFLAGFENSVSEKCSCSVQFCMGK